MTKSMSFKQQDHWFRITKSNGKYKFERDNKVIERAEFSAAYKQYKEKRG